MGQGMVDEKGLVRLFIGRVDRVWVLLEYVWVSVWVCVYVCVLIGSG